MGARGKVLLVAAAGAVGLVALAGGSGSGAKRTTPDDEDDDFDLAAMPGEDDDDELYDEAGTIVRDFEASPNEDHIDKRTVRLGPLLPSIPEGTVLWLRVELFVAGEGPAMPGAAPTPCKSIGAVFEYGPHLNERERDYFVRDGCDELRKRGGSDYDVHFPAFDLIERSDGLYFVYTFVGIRHEQGFFYYQYPHRVRLQWELLDA